MSAVYLLCRKYILADEPLSADIFGIYTSKEKAERAKTFFNLDDNEIEMIEKDLDVEYKASEAYFSFTINLDMDRNNKLYPQFKFNCSTTQPWDSLKNDMQYTNVYLYNIPHCNIDYWVKLTKLTDLDLNKNFDQFRYQAQDLLLNESKQTLDDICKLIERTKMYIDPHLIFPEQEIALLAFDFDSTFNLYHVTEDAKKIFSTLLKQFQQVFKEVFYSYFESEFYTKFDENEKNKLINKIQDILYSAFPGLFSIADLSVNNIFKEFITQGDYKFITQLKTRNARDKYSKDI